MWPFHLLKLPLATFIKQDRRKRQDDCTLCFHCHILSLLRYRTWWKLLKFSDCTICVHVHHLHVSKYSVPIIITDCTMLEWVSEWVSEWVCEWVSEWEANSAFCSAISWREFSMRWWWWWGPFCTRPTRWVGFLWCYLTETTVRR
jgi:hypothetical protein